MEGGSGEEGRRGGEGRREYGKRRIKWEKDERGCDGRRGGGDWGKRTLSKDLWIYVQCVTTVDRENFRVNLRSKFSR